MTRFRWDCRDGANCYVRQRFDPAIFDDLLPRGASFTDMDAWAEINGRLLFIEHKSAEGFMENGQRRALLRLAKLPYCSVWSIRDAPGGYDLRDMSDPARLFFRSLPCQVVQHLVSEWGRHADERGSL